MTEPSVFDYWLADNSMNYKWQLNRLRANGVDGQLDTNGNVKFTSQVETELGKFLNGKVFNPLTWEEVSDTLVQPTPVPVVPTPVPDVAPEPVVVPEPTTVAPESTPTPVPDTPVVPEPTPDVQPTPEPVAPTPDPTPVVPTPDAAPAQPTKKTRRPSPTHVDG